MSPVVTVIKLALYVSRFNFVGLLKSKISNFQIAKSLDPKFVLALEPKVIKLQGIFFQMSCRARVFGAGPGNHTEN